MRGWIVASLCIVASSGCATRPRVDRRGASLPAEGRDAEGPRDAVPAAALVFDVPVAALSAPPSLARAPRAPAAFVGFEDPIIEYHSVLSWDQQIHGDGDWYDHYERRAVSERVGVLHR